MKSILAFIYDFPHEKSVLGLLELAALGYDVICLAAPRKTLNIRQSKVRVTPIYDDLPHPMVVAEKLGFRYVIGEHSGTSCLFLSELCDRGIVLGARVLPKVWTDRIPILNLHPGVLPHNRGLDNLKWAVYFGLPQAVSAHVINEKVDSGILLKTSKIMVYPDDSLVDIHMRLLRRQISMIKDLMKMHTWIGTPLQGGTYRTAMDEGEEQVFKMKFPDYKMRYQEIYDRKYRLPELE